LGLKSENFIIAKDIKATLEKWNRNFDLIICTNSGLLPLEELYFPLLRPEGVICLCGLPEEKLPAMFGQVIIGRSISLAGSLIAGTKEIKEMLQLAVDKGVKPWIETRPMATAARACKDFEHGHPRYRYVLFN
jgi:alcohol dehydrogenase (NADP+)